MDKFVTDSDGTVHRASRFNSFSRVKHFYVAEGEDDDGIDRRFVFDRSEIEALKRPAAMPCPAGYYALKPYVGKDGTLEGVVRTPVLGWTTSREYPDCPTPLTLDGPCEDTAVLCPDGQVVIFDTVYATVEDYMDELRQFEATKKSA